MRRWLFILCLLTACVVGPKKTNTNTPAQPSFDAIDSVDTLEAEISDGMRALGLVESSGDTAMSMPNPPDVVGNQPTEDPVATVEAKDKEKERGLFKSRSEAKKAAKQDTRDTCERTCDLVDNICDASVRICQLTDKMTNDPEAPKRCERAKNACERARKQGETCGCSQ